MNDWSDPAAEASVDEALAALVPRLRQFIIVRPRSSAFRSPRSPGPSRAWRRN
jgi:hypothetical protein